MRIALISPKWNKKANDYPPLGLAYLAAVLEADGHQVRIFDLGLEPDRSLADDVQRISTFDPQVIGITSMTNLYHSAMETATLLKAQLGRPIIIGGPHATVYPERVLRESPVIDYVVRGEGEETFRELVEALDGNSRVPSATLGRRFPDLGRINGLSYRLRGEVVSNPDRVLIGDLDALPFPARHLFDLQRYGLRTPSGQPMVTILSSRGCPYNCGYCFKGIVGRTYRQRSPGNIIAELRQVMDQYRIRNFYFIDDLFTLDVRRLQAITDQLINEKLDIRWQCLGRVDRVTAEILQKMYAAGCRRIHFGIESGNQQVLDRISKGIRLQQVRQAVRWAQDAGISVKGYFMLGLPGDTEETMQQTIDLAAELNMEETMFSLTTPFPGTRLWDELVAKRPETEYNPDFSRAYYYGDLDGEVEPFLNVSEVSDATLSRWMGKARRTLAQSRSRDIYLRSFGPWLGPVLWRISRFEPVRALARPLLRWGWFKRFAGLRAERVSTWS
ncbi:MAG: radical SAM protein [Chloroflexi bacterium]|nr:radical SAM protein [Chloroflexota bacterium]